MAYVRINRHVLAEIAINNKFIRIKLDEIDNDLTSIRDTYQKNLALQNHLVEEINLQSENEGVK